MSYASIDDLRSQLGAPQVDQAYAEKQLHEVPRAPVVKRGEFILERVKGKRVLEFGASGPMHEAIMNAADRYVGVDRAAGLNVIGFNLDNVANRGLPPLSHAQLDYRDGTIEMAGLVESNVGSSYAEDLLAHQHANTFDVIVCGEVIEHLSNPGWFLERLKRQYAGVPVIITVPNAHSSSGMKSLHGGVENCNRDHVAWYSYRTLLTLVTRVGYVVKEFAWYNGQPLFAEGLIFVVE